MPLRGHPWSLHTPCSYSHPLKWALLKVWAVVNLHIDGTVTRVPKQRICDHLGRGSIIHCLFLFLRFLVTIIGVSTLQASFCWSSVTLSYVLNAFSFSDRCPVGLWITCSCMLALNKSVVPVARRLWLVQCMFKPCFLTHFAQHVIDRVDAYLH